MKGHKGHKGRKGRKGRKGLEILLLRFGLLSGSFFQTGVRHALFNAAYLKKL